MDCQSYVWKSVGPHDTYQSEESSLSHFIGEGREGNVREENGRKEMRKEVMKRVEKKNKENRIEVIQRKEGNVYKFEK